MNALTRTYGGKPMASPYVEIAEQCAQRDGWEQMTAFERTLVACEAFTYAGMRVPSWATLREHVLLKGSAADINRGISAYRERQGERLVELSSVSPLLSDLPAPVAALMRQLWEVTAKMAHGHFDGERQNCDSMVEQALASLETVRVDLGRERERSEDLAQELDSVRQELARTRDDYIARLAAAESERDTLRVIADSLKEDLQRQAVEAGERVVQITTEIHAAADKRVQDAETGSRDALARLQAVLDEAAGARKWMMTEVDKARQEAAAFVAREREHATSAVAAAQSEHAARAADAERRHAEVAQALRRSLEQSYAREEHAQQELMGLRQQLQRLLQEQATETAPVTHQGQVSVLPVPLPKRRPIAPSKVLSKATAKAFKKPKAR